MKRRDFLKTVATGALGATLLSKKGETADAAGTGTAKGPERTFRTIDAYTHFSTMEFLSLLEELSGIKPNPFRALLQHNLPLIDPAERIKAMDAVGADLQILVPLPYLESSPPVYLDRGKALRAAQHINNAIADVVARYPKRFLGVALLPTVHVDDMLLELQRAVAELHMVGGYFAVSPEIGKAPDHPDYMRLYTKACDLDVPLWIHPARSALFPDYAGGAAFGEPISKYNIWMTMGWPMDSSVAMTRMVFSGVFKIYPDLKIVIHHRGALIPFWFNRINEIVLQQAQQGVKIGPPYIDHFRKFYVDTACNGVEPEQMKMAYSFFDPDRVLFGTDTPLDGAGGRKFYHDARESLARVGISDEALTKVYSANVLKIVRGTKT